MNPWLGLILGSIQAHGTLDVELPAGPPLWRFSEPAECERVLTETGFSNIIMQEVPLIWSSTSPEEFVKEIPTSTARLGPLLIAQSDAQRATIEQAMRDGAAKYASDDGIRIPTAVVLASGQKP